MPNWVTSYLRASRETIHALLTEDGVDFNRIIPMPDDVIRGGVGNATIDGVYQKVYYPEPVLDENGKPQMGKPIPYPEGATDWYDWSIEHWGTKWNAADSSLFEDDTVVRFDTAWSHPYPVVAELSKRFPEDLIQVMYADEDLGSNFGVYVAYAGEISQLPCADEGTDEGREMASLIKYGQHYEDLWNEEEHIHFTTTDVLRHALHGPKGE